MSQASTLEWHLCSMFYQLSCLLPMDLHNVQQYWLGLECSVKIMNYVDKEGRKKKEEENQQCSESYPKITMLHLK